MLLEIDDWRTVGDLQYRFNKCFSNLNLQIFHAESKVRASQPLPADSRLQQIRKVHQPGVLTLKSWFTCRHVEQLLRDHFGIKARVTLQLENEESWKPEFARLTLQQLNESVQTGQTLQLH